MTQASLLLACFALLSALDLAQSEPFTIGIRDDCDPELLTLGQPKIENLRLNLCSSRGCSLALCHDELFPSSVQHPPRVQLECPDRTRFRSPAVCQRSLCRSVCPSSSSKQGCEHRIDMP